MFRETLTPAEPVADEVDGFYGRERDRPISLHWRAGTEVIRSLPIAPSSDRHEIAARNSILTEAVLAAEAGQWVSYSRHKPHYSGQRRYHGPAYGFTTVPPTVDALERAGLLEHDRAPPGRRGWQSRFKATPHLRKLWHGARATFRRPEVLYLKNEDKSLIDYKDTDRTRQMRRDLQGINEFLRTIEFDLNAPDAVRTGYHVELDGAFYLPLIEPEVYRVFNRSSWHMGGRLYGWWQALPKIRRVAALINGEPVREPDFGSMHAAILYARLGHSLDFDPYETGDHERQDGKLAFVIAINARSPAGAINAIASKLGGDKRSAADLYQAICHRNRLLHAAGAFGSDQGAGLMREDSEITLAALKACMRAGIPALPIHDSMLTAARHEGCVAEFMQDSFAKRFNGSIRCSVRVSGELVPHMPSPALPPSLPASPLPSLLPVLEEIAGATSFQGCSPDGQMSFLGMLEDRAPEQDAVAEANIYEGGIIPDPVIRLVRDMRRRRGERQEDVARKLGISRPQLANAERQRVGLGRGPAVRLKRWIAGGVAAA